MAIASFSGKFQIDGGQSLVLNNQVSVGWSASLVFALPPGTPAVQAGPGGKPPATMANSSTQTAKVLNGPATAQMVAIHADIYPSDANPGTLTVTFEGDDLEKSPPEEVTTSLNLTGDLVIANADLLQKICPDWESITVTSTIAKPITVQILVVWSPG